MSILYEHLALRTQRPLALRVSHFTRHCPGELCSSFLTMNNIHCLENELCVFWLGGTQEDRSHPNSVLKFSNFVVNSTSSAALGRGESNKLSTIENGRVLRAREPAHGLLPREGGILKNLMPRPKFRKGL